VRAALSEAVRTPLRAIPLCSALVLVACQSGYDSSQYCRELTQWSGSGGGSSPTRIPIDLSAEEVARLRTLLPNGENRDQRFCAYMRLDEVASALPGVWVYNTLELEPRDKSELRVFKSFLFKRAGSTWNYIDSVEYVRHE
jgi:hypothetical protein